MDYPLENLDPETFQQVVQALITRENPNVQCFPVIQPDGGRDAVTYALREGRDFIVYQAKFVRNPQAADAHKWLVRTIEEEAPKVASLIPRGARQFILITNVRGTSHLDVGSIDRLHGVLSANFQIPASCWWRDDINRRLDDAWNIKWLYSQLMTGPDLIRAVLESTPKDGQVLRDNAIRAFITYQYQMDREVKFRQVELQNRLFDLFVDVPIGPPQSASVIKDQQRYYRLYDMICHKVAAESGLSDSTTRRATERDRPRVGGAAFLLAGDTQRGFSRIVLEGAPGQGKSTVTQYVCQVHRMRLLERTDGFEHIPQGHVRSPRRLPLKVDLRDFAAWLSGKNPFLPEAEISVQTSGQRNLETFLAALVHYQSGGIQFSVGDLHAVGRLSALLLVFDGLDEVADIARRSDVVDEILLGLARLEANCASLQVVVTSRPAAFANSPGMPSDVFIYFQLSAVDRTHIAEYTEKWARARRLQPREAAEMRQILKEKLDQPHLRDLARNPMQLAILLSLIHTRGSSLPDKRTSLYDNYVDLFFSREAEKSPTVRKHRDLLVNIHRYLAWILHTASEEGNESGAIEEGRLLKVLATYLSHEGHDPALAGELFTGMVERVVALVSRVQGTFEFEVQPLREYFAARYLYETAPYSPPGNEQRGTKPDRFDAIARNFYWFNVARFYAGCYSKGELPSLIDGLAELARDPAFKTTSHPALLAATLLSDWVFTQHPRSVREVVKIILSGLGLRYVISSARRQVESGHPLVLPKGCGQEELVGRALNDLERMPARDYALDLIDLIRANAGSDEILMKWRFALCRNTERRYWLESATQLGIVHLLSLDELSETVSESGALHAAGELLLRARRFDFFDQKEEHFAIGVDVILNLGVIHLSHRRDHFLEVLAASVDPYRILRAIANGADGMTLDEVFRQQGSSNPETPGYNDWKLVAVCRRLIGSMSEASTYAVVDWRTSIEPWDEWVETGREAFGPRCLFAIAANLSAGVKSTSQLCSEANSLCDESKSLCKRVRYARLRAGQSKWWESQLKSAAPGQQMFLVLLTIFTWASPNVLARLLRLLDSLLMTLAEDDWHRLFRALSITIRDRLHRGASPHRLTELDVSVGERTAVALYLRTHSQKIFDRYIRTYSGNDIVVAELQMSSALEFVETGKDSWSGVLPLFKTAFARGGISPRYAYPHYVRRRGAGGMPADVARIIVSEPEMYPGFVVAVAQEMCRSSVAKDIRPVGQVARTQRWFV